MFNTDDGVPEWKKEILRRRQCRSRGAGAAGVQATTVKATSSAPDVGGGTRTGSRAACHVFALSSAGMVVRERRRRQRHGDAPITASGDSDSSEELRYGPGIVSRLKNRYLNLALRKNVQVNDTPTALRKAASMEDILDCEMAARSERGFKKRAAHCGDRWNAWSHNDGKKTDLKRARSVEAISSSGRDGIFLDVLITGNSDNVRSKETCEIAAIPAAIPAGGYTARVNRPKRVAPIMDEKEKPRVDVVRETKKLFERPELRTRPPQITGEVAAKVASYKNMIVQSKQPGIIKGAPTLRAKHIVNITGTSKVNTTTPSILNDFTHNIVFNGDAECKSPLQIHEERTEEPLPAQMTANPVPDVSMVSKRGDVTQGFVVTGLCETPDLILHSGRPDVLSSTSTATRDFLRAEIIHHTNTSELRNPKTEVGVDERSVIFNFLTNEDFKAHLPKVISSEKPPSRILATTDNLSSKLNQYDGDDTLSIAYKNEGTKSSDLSKKISSNHLGPSPMAGTPTSPRSFKLRNIQEKKHDAPPTMKTSVSQHNLLITERKSPPADNLTPLREPIFENIPVSLISPHYPLTVEIPTIQDHGDDMTSPSMVNKHLLGLTAEVAKISLLQRNTTSTSEKLSVQRSMSPQAKHQDVVASTKPLPLLQMESTTSMSTVVTEQAPSETSLKHSPPSKVFTTAPHDMFRNHNQDLTKPQMLLNSETTSPRCHTAISKNHLPPLSQSTPQKDLSHQPHLPFIHHNAQNDLPIPNSPSHHSTSCHSMTPSHEQDLERNTSPSERHYVNRRPTNEEVIVSPSFRDVNVPTSNSFMQNNVIVREVPLLTLTKNTRNSSNVNAFKLNRENSSKLNDVGVLKTTAVNKLKNVDGSESSPTGELKRIDCSKSNSTNEFENIDTQKSNLTKEVKQDFRNRVDISNTRMFNEINRVDVHDIKSPVDEHKFDVHKLKVSSETNSINTYCQKSSSELNTQKRNVNHESHKISAIKLNRVDELNRFNELTRTANSKPNKIGVPVLNKVEIEKIKDTKIVNFGVDVPKLKSSNRPRQEQNTFVFNFSGRDVPDYVGNDGRNKAEKIHLPKVINYLIHLYLSINVCSANDHYKIGKNIVCFLIQDNVDLITKEKIHAKKTIVFI